MTNKKTRRALAAAAIVVVGSLAVAQYRKRTAFRRFLRGPIYC